MLVFCCWVLKFPDGETRELNSQIQFTPVAQEQGSQKCRAASRPRSFLLAIDFCITVQVIFKIFWYDQIVLFPNNFPLVVSSPNTVN